MPTITINGQPYDVHQDVKDYLNQVVYERDMNYQAAVAKNMRVQHLEELILNYQTKTETVKHHPTKDYKLLAWKARVQLFDAVRVKIKQSNLFT